MDYVPPCWTYYLPTWRKTIVIFMVGIEFGVVFKMII